MKNLNTKTELQSSLSSMLTYINEGIYSRKEYFGNFYCATENFGDFSISRRRFETHGETLHIPFTLKEPCVQMLFSFDGTSFFNNRNNPFTLRESSHCINFFQGYNCTNLVSDRSRQDDITVRLRKDFYASLIAEYSLSAETKLMTMIATGREFNTINQHLPLDAAISGLLRNINECPFEGGLRNTYLREHVRAIFTLQLFHFNSIVTGQQTAVTERISKSDRDKLHDIRSFIDQHFLNPASLDSLCKEFGLNEFKLKQGFKILFETSPIRYLQYKRLAFALDLLRNTEKTVKEVSREVGYSHTSNFTTAFVRLFGRTPQSYRS